MNAKAINFVNLVSKLTEGEKNLQKKKKSTTYSKLNIRG